MELEEDNLGPLITDYLDRAQIPGNICQSAFSIFNNGRHCCELAEAFAPVIQPKGSMVF